jgi:DNA (cytosine-5)-methyltransferase 1
MKFLSVCSGIEAASVAWGPLGWEAVAFSEIAKFPAAVLAHHWPEIPNLGDMTRYHEWPDSLRFDVLCGGTPCQGFSLAGLRKGLDDPRSQLSLVFVEIAARYRPRWLVWENVPGVLSSEGGSDFATLLATLTGRQVSVPQGGWQNSGHVQGIQAAYGVAWRVLDAQHFGVPQRRRRVFLVGYLGDWRRAAAVLFERASLRGDPPPSRETWQRIAGTLTGRAGNSSRPAGANGNIVPETVATLDASYGRLQGASGQDASHCHSDLVPAISPSVPTVASTLKANNGGGGFGSDPNETFIPVHTTGAGYWQEGFGTLRGREQDSHENLIAFDTTQITSAENCSNPQPGDPCHPLAAGAHAPAIAIQAGALKENPSHGPDGMGVREDDTAYTLEARAEVQAVAYRTSGNCGAWETGDQVDTLTTGSDPNGHVLAFSGRSRGDDGRGYERAPQVFEKGVVGTIDTVKPHCVAGPTMAVRRLTPRECERLQGFPDDHTLIPTKATLKISRAHFHYLRAAYPDMTAEEAMRLSRDGPRYKALGNSWATVVAKWVGERITLVEKLSQTEEGAA